ncbi:hypothetical protein AA309_20060 [Microvirga vignae]|uniref:DUF2312 domain-containing protein n=1 Tax=Microvirga vignae TaxID=1225564 RepID=A0A0H1R8M6_9HYPH|nr:hypothetical protein [Microvirga vignae]KLK91399.1 hypothetical protein AA309_20060 [Microvirga vignae]
MHITPERARSIADSIDAYDADIELHQAGKRETYADLRTELESLGLDRATVSLEIAALKAAIAMRRKRRADPEKVDEKDAVTSDYFEAIDVLARERVARVREKPVVEGMTELQRRYGMGA